ncbi:hypothetical protein [Halomonas sp. DN3]|uniref:hypothetical protein n=1 Tax=Halomonas sp. DN3 TaxID=2953657 RepID=UPI0020A1DA77|nr:hypothetical protein [Halomonas sp. DN3]USZ48269.1 hypothetical protein NKF27_12125 [Halomonas sp. DN3]
MSIFASTGDINMAITDNTIAIAIYRDDRKVDFAGINTDIVFGGEAPATIGANTKDPMRRLNVLTNFVPFGAAMKGDIGIGDTVSATILGPGR